jgi:hypothetical protein
MPLRYCASTRNGQTGERVERSIDSKTQGMPTMFPLLRWSSARCFQMFGGNGLLRTARPIFPPDCIGKGHHLGW